MITIKFSSITVSFTKMFFFQFSKEGNLITRGIVVSQYFISTITGLFVYVNSRSLISYFWLKLFLVSISLTVQGIDYGSLLVPGGGRQIPPELLLYFENKTLYEQEIEECMVEYSECVSITAFRNKPICALNSVGKEREFLNMCDMTYENCKNSESWGYFRDDHC